MAATLAVVALLGSAVSAGVVWRRSLRAAYRAFLNPELVEQPSIAVGAANPCELDIGPPGDLDAHIAREFRPLDALALDDPDAAQLAGLTTTDLTVAITRRTMRFVRFFGTDPVGRKAFETRYRRAGRYRSAVERQLREAGLPEDLVWLAAIESAFDPEALSAAGAAGLWQFMPETATLYGLELSPWLDERRSLTRATEAAVTHLRDLFERLGTWDLALAAYNHGYDGVLHALKQYVEEHSSDRPLPRRAASFTDLAQAQLLPLETADYVPKLTAFAMVAANLTRFDLDHVQPDPPLRIATLSVPAGTRLRMVATAAGLSTAELSELNPELLRDRVPPTGGDYLLTLPAERLDHARAALPAYLDHEVLLLEDGLSLPAQPAPLVLGSAPDPTPMPPPPGSRRLVHLGPNRLPAFPVPGRAQPERWRAGASIATLDAALPERFMGVHIGWQRPSDPFSLLRRRSDEQGRAQPVDPAIAKHLRFLSHRPVARLPRVPYDETRLPGGMTLRLQQDPKAPRVAITIRLGRPSLPGAIGDTIASSGSEGEIRFTETVSKRNLDVGIAVAVGRLAVLLGQSRQGPVAALRSQLNRRRRQVLAERPYGPSWLALSDALFPPDGPHAGRIVSPDPRDSALRTHRLLLAGLGEERSPEQVTISVVGYFDRQAAMAHLQNAWQTLGPDLGAASRPNGGPAGPIRLIVRDHVPSPRALYGWSVPPQSATAAAALRVAVHILAGKKESRFRRALVEPELAATVRGIVDGGSEGSAVALELTPVATVVLEKLERRADSIIAQLGEEGPNRVELAHAKAILRYRLRKQIERATGPPSPDFAQATLGGRIAHALRPGYWQRALEALAAVEEPHVRKAVGRHLQPDHRVVVVTMPEDATTALD